jgi:hypothetical protein
MKIRQENCKTLVLDILRRRYVRLTPEEMVRQCFINYLIEYKGYPAALMGNEVQLSVGEKKLRCDSVLYDRNMQPRMIIEYKAPDIEITEKVLHQILSYNTQLNVKYLIMSNGTQHVCLRYNDDSGRWEFMPEIPNYVDL